MPKVSVPRDVRQFFSSTIRTFQLTHQAILLRMLRPPVLVAVIGLSLGRPQTATGQELVTVDAAGFQPDPMTIAIGDSVLWFNIDSESTHTTTSDKPAGHPDYWNVSLEYSQFYTRTFVRAAPSAITTAQPATPAPSSSPDRRCCN